MTTQDFSQFGPSAEVIFRHWHTQAQVESPEEVLDRFQQLFIDGTSYPDAMIRSALTQVLNNPVLVREFNLILNRCCYILINHWKTSRTKVWAVKELVALLGRGAKTPTRSRSTLQLRKLVSAFLATSDYQRLQDAARDARVPIALKLKAEAGFVPEAEAAQPLILTLDRYPFLYRHLTSVDLKSESVPSQMGWLDIDPNLQLKQFHQNLEQYFQQWQALAEPTQDDGVCRQSQSDSGLLTHSVPNRLSKPVFNPTILTDRELNLSLRHFTGPIEGSASYPDLAKRFTQQVEATPNFRRFKEDLCDYLIAAIDPGYGKHSFNRRLQERIRNVMPESDCQSPSEFLRHSTYRELFYFLVVDTSIQHPRYEVFLDLLSNLGHLKTTGLLLRITLLWRQAHVFLEQRFAVLFRHHRDALLNQVGWLVQALGFWSVVRWLHFDRPKALTPL